MAVNADEVAVLLFDGKLRVYSRTNWRELRELAFGDAATSRPFGLEAGTSGEWYVLTEEMRGARGGLDRVAMLVLKRLSLEQRVVLMERPRWNLASLGPEVNDRASLAVSQDTVFVGGSLPARVLSVVHGRHVVEIPLAGTPIRPLGPEEVAMIEAGARGLPEAYQSAVKGIKEYPAIQKLWRIKGGFVALAAGGRNSVQVDVYCDNRFVGTRLAGQSVRDAWSIPDGIAVLRVDEEAEDFAIELYSDAQAGLQCP